MQGPQPSIRNYLYRWSLPDLPPSTLFIAAGSWTVMLAVRFCPNTSKKWFVTVVVGQQMRRNQVQACGKWPCFERSIFLTHSCVCLLVFCSPLLQQQHLLLPQDSTLKSQGTFKLRTTARPIARPQSPQRQNRGAANPGKAFWLSTNLREEDRRGNDWNLEERTWKRLC